MDKLKRTASALLLALAALPLSAQQDAAPAPCGGEGGAYLFRFVAGRDMFFSPWNGNGAELARLQSAVSARLPAIGSGRMYVYVAGGGPDPSSAVARTRRNRVKSELIVRCGLLESHFVTDRRPPGPRGAGEVPSDAVVVVLPAPAEDVAALAGPDAAARVSAYAREQSACAARGEAERLARVSAYAREQSACAARGEAERLAREEAARLAAGPARRPGRLSLRANLLRWATLTPDAGVEWRVGGRWSVQLNGTWTSWSWDGKSRRYALWEASPEARLHLGASRRAYVGAMLHAGQFNYKLSGTGRQGDLWGGGLVGGCALPLGGGLSLDLTLGAGCTHADLDLYRVVGGVRVRTGSERRDRWGVNRLGVSLVWTPFQTNDGGASR